MIAFAGVLGVGVALAMMEIIDAYSVSRSAVSLTLATVVGAFGICVIASMSAWRVRQKLSEQNFRLDVALNNMNQGLCMFDARGRIAIWNERYRQMYNIDPRDIWRGCSVPDLLAARMNAGTFPLDPERYDADLRAVLMQGKAFTLNVELKDGRTIAVVNLPMPGGGWVATHEDVSERKRAERELESTRTFLNTIIENVPSPIIVKSMPALQYLLINRAAEKYLGIDRSAMLGKTVADVMPPSSAQTIEAEDQKSDCFGPDLFLRRTHHADARQRHERHRDAIDGEGRWKIAVSYQRHQRPDRTETQRTAHRASGPSRCADRPSQSRRVQ
jgi:PAS domain-containing protein